MTSKPRKTLLSASLAGVLTLAGVCLAGSGETAFARQGGQSDDTLAADNGRHNYASIEGTWRVTVTQKVCSTGTPIGPPFQSLLTFAQGGTMTGTTANSAFLPGQRTGDYGIWTPGPGHTVTATEEAFIIFGGGFFTQGSQVIDHSITLTKRGNEFSDEASVQFYDVNRNPLSPGPGCASAVGQRLK